MGLKSKITLTLLLAILLFAMGQAFSLRIAYAQHDHSGNGHSGHDQGGGDHGGSCGHNHDKQKGGGSQSSSTAVSPGKNGGVGPSASSSTPTPTPAPSTTRPASALTGYFKLPSYPVYYEPTLLVIMINVVNANSTSVSDVHQFAVGTPLVIQFRVTDFAGRPVTLSPLIASFGFTNSSGASYLLAAVAVSPVSTQPGNYTYALIVSSDFPQGVVTASVVANSLRDAEGGIGPTETIASHNSIPPFDQTPSLFDNSIFAIAPPFAYIPPATFPSMVLALILLTLILQVRVRHGKTRAKKD